MKHILLWSPVMSQHGPKNGEPTHARKQDAVITLDWVGLAVVQGPGQRERCEGTAQGQQKTPDIESDGLSFELLHDTAGLVNTLDSVGEERATHWATWLGLGQQTGRCLGQWEDTLWSVECKMGEHTGCHWRKGEKTLHSVGRNLGKHWATLREMEKDTG